MMYEQMCRRCDDGAAEDSEQPIVPLTGQQAGVR